MTNPTRPADVRYQLLVGTYTAGSSAGIQVFDFDDRAGRIGERRQEMPCSNPSWLVLSPSADLLYAVHEDSEGRVGRFRRDASGRLEACESQPSEGDHPTHASLAADGRHLFVANYAADREPGVLSVLPVTAEGTLLRARHKQIHARGSAVDPERQAHGHVHCVVSDPSGRYLFACDLGADEVVVHRYQPDSESPLQPASHFEAPLGSGPRHLVFSQDGRFAYLTLELSGELLALAHAEGVLTPLQRLRLAPDGFQGKVAAGALHLSADGRFLYAVDRGEHNHLVAYRVDPDTGRLDLLQRRSCEGQEPREFALSPSGRFLLVANQGSDCIRLFERDPHDGRIGALLQTVSVGAPSDFVFVSLP